MPRSSASSSLVVAKKPRVRRAKASTPITHAPAPSSCQACRSLPIGSIELVSLLLVLIFSLSAVLMTSGYALSQKNAEIANLQSQVQQ